jgi:hypothetical protein
MVEGHAMGRSPDALAAEMLRVLGPQAMQNPAAEPRGCASSRGKSRCHHFDSADRGEIIMTALRMRARDFLSEKIDRGAQRSTWKGIALIAHAWALIFGSIALVAWWPNPLTFCWRSASSARASSGSRS